METTPADARRKQRVEKQPLEVYLRVRPLLKEEKEQGQTSCFQLSESSTQATITSPESAQSYTHSQNETETRFEFTRVFKPEDGQEQVFAHTGKPLVQQFLSGKNCLLFAYGNTNAGKTFTVNGNEAEPGVLPRILEMVFAQLSEMGKDAQYEYHILATYLEIYNETIIDLLAFKKEEKVEIKEDKTGVIFVTGVKEERVQSPEDGKRLLHIGQQNRKVAETALNHDSSRSHSVFTIKLIRMQRGGSPEERRASVSFNKLSIVDLAGSERAKRTQNTGARLREAASINTSLMTFGRVVSILRDNQNLPSHLQQVVPFRESKLTRLVQDFFLGSGRAMMIVNVTPAARDYDESLQVLRFSSLAKEVCTNSRPQKKKPTEPETPLSSQTENRVSRTPLIRPSRSETVTELKEEIHDLKMKLIERESQTGRMEMSIRAECANLLAERLIEMEVKYKQRLQRYETMADDKYQRKMSIWSDTLRLCQTPEQNAEEDTCKALQDVCKSLQEQLREKDKEIESLKKRLELEEASKTVLVQKLQLQVEMYEAMERDKNSHRDSWLKEKTQEYEVKTQSLQMQLSQQKLHVERLSERCRELESQHQAERSPVPKIVVTPPKGERAEKCTPSTSSPVSSLILDSSLSCNEEDALDDSETMSDVSLETPRKDKRKRIFPRVMSAKKKLCTTKKKADKEAKARSVKHKDTDLKRKRSISCPSLARLANESTPQATASRLVPNHEAGKPKLAKASLIEDEMSPIMSEAVTPKGRRHSSLFFSSADEKENTPENSPVPTRKPKALFSMKTVDEPTAEPKRGKKIEGKKSAKNEKPKGKIQKKTTSRTILNRKAKAPSYLQNLKKPFQG